MAAFKRICSISNLYRGYGQTLRPVQNSIRNATSKEIGFVKPASHNDFLLQNLKSAASIQEVFNIVSSHHKIMNSKHILQALKIIFTAQKVKEPELPVNELVANPEFKKLCARLKSQVRSIDVNETIEALKILCFVGVPSNSTIAQSLLQMIRHNINHLSLQQIIFLDFVLQQFKGTPLCEALLMALPVLFEVHLPLKMDGESLPHLTDLLQYAARRGLSDATVQLLVAQMLQHNGLNATEAQSIVWSLCDLRPQEAVFAPLLQRALDTLCAHGQRLRMSDLETTLTKLNSRVCRGLESYYHEDFYDLVAHQVIQQNLGFQPALWILQKITRVHHVNHRLLEYVLNQCRNEPGLLARANLKNLSIAVDGFASLPCGAGDAELLCGLLRQNLRQLVWREGDNLLRLAAGLATLGVLDERLLDHVFSSEQLAHLAQHGSADDHEHFLVLVQAAGTARPPCVLVPSAAELDRIRERQPRGPMEHPLRAALEAGCGGAGYVLTGLRTRLGHYLDHTVVLRKGGFPVALASAPPFLEDLQVPADSQVLAVQACDRSCYSANCARLRPARLVSLRSLEALGAAVVAVPLERWRQLPDHEKVPFLMREVRLRGEQDGTRCSQLV